VSRSVPWHRSLLMRLLAASFLIAVCSIAATAWLAVQSTTRALEQAQGQALSTDAKIYDALGGYASTHPSWTGVTPLLQKLSVQTGREITLTTQDRDLIGGSSGVDQPLPLKESARVDPLYTDPALQRGYSSRIDVRALGPYRLSAAQREIQQVIAGKMMDCMEGLPEVGQVTPLADLAGYIGFQYTDASLRGNSADGLIAKNKWAFQQCHVPALAVPSAAESHALRQLERAQTECQKRLGSYLTKAQIQTCIDKAKRKQLEPFVAPAALLFVRGHDGVAQSQFNLSRTTIAKTAGATVLILLLTVTVTALVGARLVRPLRALTAAAQHPDTSHTRVFVTGHDEISVLAMSLNNLSERRERAEEQRTAMVSDIAHELRSPLTNIRSWLEALEDGLATPASDPALAGALLREALQLQHIIDDLQELAVADAAGMRLSPEQVPIDELLDQVITAHGGKAEASRVYLTAHSPDRLELIADPVRMRQALGNLVTNAIRHTPPEGSVSLVARTDGDDVVISVVDDGTGIAEVDLPNVFDRFWRADRSRSRDTGGSGLGLAIVRQIAEAHGGSVSVTSLHGRGTCFALRLPLCPPATP
jgi:signal transduction histidine kinase